MFIRILNGKEVQESLLRGQKIVERLSVCFLKSKPSLFGIFRAFDLT